MTAADAAVSLDLSAKEMVKAGNTVKLEASCGDESCEATAQVTYKVPKTTTVGIAASTELKAKKITKSVAAERTKTLKLKLGPKAKRKLKQAATTKQDRKRIKVIVKATAADSAGNEAKGKLKLKLK